MGRVRVGAGRRCAARRVCVEGSEDRARALRSGVRLPRFRCARSQRLSVVLRSEPVVTPVQRSVRILGLLFLVTAVCGGFGEGYVPGKIIVAGNGPATMDNVAAHEMLFRAGFAAYLAEAMCDVAIALIFYALLRPVQKD